MRAINGASSGVRLGLLILLASMALAMQVHAGGQPGKDSDGASGDIADWLTQHSVSNGDGPYVQDILEHGATGVMAQWVDPKDNSIRRGIPQPPQSQADGTFLREIEIPDINGRYLRVLWSRDINGIWTKQNFNLDEKRREDLSAQGE